MSFVIGFEVVDPTATGRTGPVRKRASKPKVRSGCVTCKIRKLKCDEGRPGCKRCAGLKVVCGGYQNNNRSSPSSQERAVVSRTASAGLEDILLLPLKHFPTEKAYSSQQEYQYFNYFTEKTGLELWLNFTPRIWKSVLEQCCSIEPSLRQLIISVGALSKIHELESPENSHLVFARKQYSKALQRFQDFITGSSPGGTSTRIILFASLMIFCFEAQHGEFNAAIRNVRNALAVLREDFAVKKDKYKHITRPLPLPEPEYEILATLIRLDQGFVGYSTEITDSNDKRIKNSTYLDFSYVKETFEIPSFSGLADARAYLTLIESRTILRVNKFMEDQGDRDFRLPCPLLSVELFNEISLDLKHWATAFAPLYSREWDYDSLEFLSASFICIQALSSDLTLRGMHFGEKGLKTKKVEKLAERIVNVAKLIVSNRRFHNNFTCETGVIAALCSVVFVCRNRDIRWSAVEVIRSTVPRREGVWDSIQTLRICEEVLEQEGDMPFLVFRSLDAFAIRFGKPPAMLADEQSEDE